MQLRRLTWLERLRGYIQDDNGIRDCTLTIRPPLRDGGMIPLQQFVDKDVVAIDFICARHRNGPYNAMGTGPLSGQGYIPGLLSIEVNDEHQGFVISFDKNKSLLRVFEPAGRRVAYVLKFYYRDKQEAL